MLESTKKLDFQPNQGKGRVYEKKTIFLDFRSFQIFTKREARYSIVNKK